MEKETEIIAVYSQKGHPQYREDTWKRERVISNKNEMFRFMKECFKDSASSFNNYPFSGLFSVVNISFKKRCVITEEDGAKYYSNTVDCEAPEYYGDCCFKYGKWYDRMKQTLPYWKKRHEDMVKEEQQFSQYQVLKDKYETK